MRHHFDLIVIGAGSAGVRASRLAATAGAKVAVIEANALGGTCVNIGCVPKKIFSYGAEFQHAWQEAPHYGWQFNKPEFNWDVLRENKTKEIERLNGAYQRILENAGVKIIHGRATLVDAHTVQVNDMQYTTERILIATGNVPQRPTFPGAEFANVSDDIFYLPKFPHHVVIVGGGYIACEFAGIFAGLGAKVTQLYRGALFLRGFDEDIRHHVAEEMRQYLDLRFHCDVKQLTKTHNKIHVHLQDDSVIDTDFVLYATGRTPNTDTLGLEKVGVALDKNRAIIVDEYGKTNVSSIYALGDVINHEQLTPVALAQAKAFVRTVYEKQPTKIDQALVPTAVFCDPNISSVGLSETQARNTYPEVKVYKTKFKPLKQTLTGRNTQTFMKLVVDATNDKVLGVHMVGEYAPEIIQGFAVALTAGATKAIFDATLGIHPTSAEEFVTMR